MGTGTKRPSMSMADLWSHQPPQKLSHYLNGLIRTPEVDPKELKALLTSCSLRLPSEVVNDLISFEDVLPSGKLGTESVIYMILVMQPMYAALDEDIKQVAGSKTEISEWNTEIPPAVLSLYLKRSLTWPEVDPKRLRITLESSPLRVPSEVVNDLISFEDVLPSGKLDTESVIYMILEMQPMYVALDEDIKQVESKVVEPQI